MNQKLVISCLLLCIVSQHNIIADTVQEEERARIGAGNEAYLTSREEERERLTGDDDAYYTGREEERERLSPDDDARATSAAGRAARS